jgi:hypothetical protein
VLVVAALALAVVRWRRGRVAAPDDDAQSLHAELKARIDKARGRRLEGDLSGATLLLVEIEQELGPASEADAASLNRVIEGARYGGYAPSREELDQIERRVERRVSELEADPGTAERLALRLRNQES